MASNNHSNNLIACTICSQVFTNTQSLITHLESHRLQENLALLRLNNINNPRFQAQFEQFPNPLQAPPQQPLAIPQPRTNQIMDDVSHQLHILQNVIPSAETNVAEMTLMSPTPPAHQNYMEVSQIDGTKPYIDMLDKPINSMFVNPPPIVNDDTLDLELKL
jgi:hypothetical protein